MSGLGGKLCNTQRWVERAIIFIINSSNNFFFSQKNDLFSLQNVTEKKNAHRFLQPKVLFNQLSKSKMYLLNDIAWVL